MTSRRSSRRNLRSSPIIYGSFGAGAARSKAQALLTQIEQAQGWRLRKLLRAPASLVIENRV